MSTSETDTTNLSRRSLLGRTAAGAAGVALAQATPAAAQLRIDRGTPRHPRLPITSSQPLGTVLTLLGTGGGPQADYVRTGTSSVLTVAGHNYVVDCGRGSVTQYLNAGLRFSKLAGIFITHLHVDHLADYYNFLVLESGAPNTQGDRLPKAISVRGPGPAGGLPPAVNPANAKIIAPADPTPGLRDMTYKLTEAYAYSNNVFILEDDNQPVTDMFTDLKDIVLPDVGASPTNTAPAMEPFEVFSDERVKVTAILVPHGKVFPSFAYRFDTFLGASVVFSGDTAPSDNLVKLAKGADVLVHEALDYDFISHLPGVNRSLLTHLKDSHTFASEVGGVAQRAGVGKLVLTHLVPSNPANVSDSRWHRLASQGFDGQVVVGNDLDRVLVGRPLAGLLKRRR